MSACGRNPRTSRRKVAGIAASIVAIAPLPMLLCHSASDVSSSVLYAGLGGAIGVVLGVLLLALIKRTRAS